MKSRDGFLLETKQLTKAFPGVIAVNSVDFQIRPGEVHALLGENGAGKSTFCKILSGIYQPTNGQIFFDGHPVVVRSPHDALSLGLSMVYQERNLIGFLSGAENICLGIETGHWGMIDNDEVKEAAVQLRDAIGADVDLGVPVEKLSVSQQQLVEILRALIHKPKLLLLDEPTASLSRNAVNLLHDVIRRISAQGVGVIYISHKLEEVFEVADRVTIMRDGKTVVTESSSELDFDSCIRYMTSQDISKLYPQNKPPSPRKSLLEVRSLSDGHKMHDVSFNVAAGEIVGFYGLIGAGRTELANALFGISPYKTGSVTLDGQELNIRNPIDALRQGIFLVPEDRDQKGLLDIFALEGNLTISVIRRFLRMGTLLSRRLEHQVAEKIVEKLGVYYFEAGKFARNLAKTNPEIKRLIDNGKLIPQEKMTKYVQDFLEKNVPGGSDILFEGYPRFIGQYLFLKKWLARRGKKIDKIIMLDVDKEEVIKRLSARRMCEDDGKIYNLITNPPKKGDCKGRLIQREDDNQEPF